MRRRRSSQPTITLFSFQDIITSVTAILILIVLILSLELITRSVQKNAGDPAATTRSLAATVADMESVVAALEAEALKAPHTSSEVNTEKPERDVKVLRDQIEWARQQLADARAIETESRSKAEIAAQAEALASEEAIDVADWNDKAKETGARAAELASENERRRTEISQKEAGPKKEGADVVFTREPSSIRQPWLLEISAVGFSALRLGAGKPISLDAGVDPNSSLARWISRLDSLSDHVLLIVRPSGAEVTHKVKPLLRSAKIPFGIELVSEEAVIRDGGTPPTREDANEEAP